VNTQINEAARYQGKERFNIAVFGPDTKYNTSGKYRNHLPCMGITLVARGKHAVLLLRNYRTPSCFQQDSARDDS